MNIKIIFIVAFVLALAINIECKAFSKDIKISKIKRRHWVTLTKFKPDFDAKIEITTSLKKIETKTSSIPTTFFLFSEKTYKMAENKLSCDEKNAYSLQQMQFYTHSDGEVTVFKKKIKNKFWRRNEFVFVVFADCDEDFINQASHSNKLQIDIQMYNQNGNSRTHFSSEKDGVQIIFPLFFIAFSIYFGFYAQKTYRSYKDDPENLNYGLLVVLIIELLYLSSMFLKMLHFFVFSFNGKGIFVFEMFAIMADTLVGIFTAVFFIMLSWGWSIKSLDYEDSDLYIMLAIMMEFFLAVVVMVEKLVYGDDEYIFHDYDFIGKYCLLVARLILFVVFIYYIKTEYQNERNKNVKMFGKKILYFGSVFILSLPLIIAICFFLDYSQQYRFIAFGELFSQAIALIYLKTMLTKGSEYKSIAMHEQTLPTNITM